MAVVIGKTSMTAFLPIFYGKEGGSALQWCRGLAHGKIMAVALNEKRRGGEEEKLKDRNVKEGSLATPAQESLQLHNYYLRMEPI